MSSRCLRFQLMGRGWSDGAWINGTSVSHYSITPYSVVHFSRRLRRAAHFRQPHADAFGVGGGDILADEIRFDGQLAVAAVNEHRQLNAPGPAEIIQRVHRGPDGPPAEQHVIHQHHRLPGHIERNDRGLDVGRDALVEVVPVHADIQAAGRDGLPPNPRQQRAQPLRQRHPAALDADQHHLAAGFIPFRNFMRNAGEGALNRRRVQDEGGFRHRGEGEV